MITTVIAYLATIPFLTFFLLFIVVKKITNKATRSTKIAADWTCVLFLISVNGLVFMLFDYSILWESVLAYMVSIAIVLTIQWRNEEEIYLFRAFRIVWRGSFILLSLGYLVLMTLAIYLELT
ncbi:DUF3397 domain-containing protein [Halalkalibacillus halophilus]|uniref:DUF3397 domain-containing protein n=1 Tax=Halalkalibacillus halophilus TaxID=392827 RepID=UPI000488EFA1|nr:DUF3397 domain-containing protein [Halalkalibacillus halophilus]